MNKQEKMESGMKTKQEIVDFMLSNADIKQDEELLMGEIEKAAQVGKLGVEVFSNRVAPNTSLELLKYRFEKLGYSVKIIDYGYSTGSSIGISWDN